MLKVELTAELVGKAVELGLMVTAEVYETEEQAEREGFYWFDEIDRWVNVEAVNAEF